MDISKYNFATKILLFIYFIQSIASGIVFYIKVFLEKNTPTLSDPVTLGSIIGSSSIGTLLAGFFSIWALKNFSHKNLSLLGLLFQAVSLVLVLNSYELYILFPAMILTGFGGTLFIISTTYLITKMNSTSEKKSKNIITAQYVISQGSHYLVKDLVHPWTKSTRQRAKCFCPDRPASGTLR